MAKTKLVTDFVKVAESGKTIDGRTIEPQWLLDAAELYSKDTYTAIITLEHYDPEWAGNYGTVEELKAEEADGKVSLYARLSPNERLVSINRSGQELFTSIKVHPNFAASGKAYVYQIGVTDFPASLGTEQLAFRAGEGEQILPGVELPPITFAVTESKSLLEQIKELLVFSAPQPTPEPEDEDIPMTKEELVAAIGEAVAAAFTAQNTPAVTPEQPAQPETPAEAITPEAFAALKTEADASKAALDALTQKFSALESKLVQEVPPTEIDSTGGADDVNKGAPKRGF